jgi:probable phosphoglycerate mutase
LSDLGREDAHKVAKALAQIGNSGPWSHLAPISAIVSSPIQRTLDTAHIISNEIGLGVEVNYNLAEISFGDWDSHTNSEVMTNWAKEFEAWQGSWTVSPPNGESLEAFDVRVQAGRREVLNAYAGKTVAIVSHVMPIRGFIRAGMDGGVAGYWRPQISPCSITIIRFWGDQAAEVITVNATSHL